MHAQRNYHTTFAQKLHYFSSSILFFYLMHNFDSVALCNIPFCSVKL